jgi:hypothetical protein
MLQNPGAARDPLKTDFAMLVQSVAFEVRAIGPSKCGWADGRLRLGAG